MPPAWRRRKRNPGLASISGSVRLASGSRLLKYLAPILHELIEPFIGEWVIEQHVEHLERHGADMRARQGRIDHVRGGTQRRREHLRLVSVVLVDLRDAA